jgi:formylglycine-generating enzyme required for sulfatase activity
MRGHKPPITGANHPLPFNSLSPADFERLCLWLVEREGFEQVEHLGASGSEQGRDIVAWRDGELWAFQCKRVTSFGPTAAAEEAGKVLGLPEAERPGVLAFLTSCNISAETRQKTREHCGKRIECHFWANTELDAKVKRHSDILEEFFQLTSEAPIPSSGEVANHRAALQERLEKDARRRWGGMSVYIQEEGATLPIEASPYQTGRLGRRENLLPMLHTTHRLLVLGEPGSGKTVALERLAWELCAGGQAGIPVLIRLFHYAGTPLEKWVQAILQETGKLRLNDERALDTFLKEGDTCCFFLFDGLNEVAPPYRDRLVDDLVRWMAAYPRHPAILTSRAQDELWRRLRGEVERTVVVQPISDGQAQAYLIAGLGERGVTLYDSLGQRLQEMARTPLILWLIKEAGTSAESVPGNRGELYARFVSRMLRRDTDRHVDAELPERIKRRALADLAYHLSLEQRLFCELEEAVRVVAERLEEDLAEKVVGACRRHGLLAGEATVWFAPHQTVQEHFAALALVDMVGEESHLSGWARLRRKGRRLLTGQATGLGKLAAEDWWAEVIVQLAGLVDESDWLSGKVVRVNPWLAWWCAEEGREVSEETRSLIASRSTNLLESDQVADRRRAVAALARMRNERVVQPLFQAAADQDREVAGLAVQALLEMGEDVRSQALGYAQQPDHALHRAGLVYLEALLGLAVVWVPPGPFLMGSDKDKDPDASQDELPQHQVTLPGYWIGRYLVTVAQFRLFAETSGYKPADEYSLRGKDDHPVRRVTWHDALAFCHWLSRETGLAVTLPSEAEWEKAARRTDGRIYPWGNEWGAERCNSWEGRARETTPVGQYSPQGDSPYGCADMAGNVWDWCRSLKKPYPYDGKDGREDPKAKGTRVLRGGTFNLNEWYVRCAYRRGNFPFNGASDIGFRIVIAPGYASGL